MKTLVILVALSLFAGLGVAQSCVQTNDCHIVQRSNTQVFTENQAQDCFFDLLFIGGQTVPEHISVTCKVNRVTQMTVDYPFVIGQCQSGNFLGNNDVEWTFCRIADSVFSWSVTDDMSYTQSGIMF